MERVESLRTENKFKKTEIGEIPVDWEVVKIQDVCEKAEYGYTESATEKQVGPKFLRISDIQNGNVNWESVPFCHCPNLKKEKYLLNPGDILFARTGATTGKSYIIKRCPEAVFASYLIRIVTKEKINSYFLFFVFNSFIYWRQIKEQIGGSAQGGVNASSLSNIKIPLPPLSEQKKIAEILTSVDEAIDKKQEILEKTKMLKKGLMQELFTKGIGHTRFKETKIGWIPEEWEVGTTKELSERIWIGLVTTMTKNYVDDGIPLIRNSNIRENKITEENMVKLNINFSEQHNNRRLRIGDIVTVHTGDIGTSAIIEPKYDGAHGFATLNTRTNEQIDNKYLCAYFNSPHFKKQAYRFATGDGRNNFNQKDFVCALIAYPRSKDEQRQIAQILSEVDAKTETEKNIKAELIQFKKGLMQVLLTGKIRIKI